MHMYVKIKSVGDFSFLLDHMSFYIKLVGFAKVHFLCSGPSGFIFGTLTHYATRLKI